METVSRNVPMPCSCVQWSMRFPVEEEVKAVAIGNGWAAAATSLHFLRVYSEAGLQVKVFPSDCNQASLMACQMVCHLSAGNVRLVGIAR